MCPQDAIAVKSESSSVFFFFDKGNILISKDTNYTWSLQQRNALMALRKHTAKK
jgi:hypothetical protein